MTITPDSPFVAPARVGAGTFAAVLAEAGSPWAGRAAELYALVVARGHDPAVWLAICAQEHSYGTNRDSVLWRHDTHSWTNARSVRDPAIAGWSLVWDDARRSHYVRYADVADSLADGCYRVSDPSYRYAREGRTTIGQVLAIWTEGDAAAYTASVVRRMNGWIACEASANAYAAILPGLVDIRHQLPRRDGADPAQRAVAGPFERRPLAEKRGAVVHYSGPPTPEIDTVEILRREARYHVDKDWARAGEPAVRGDGLMYHVAVGRDGTAYLCRDLEAVLWHCGAWPQNALALSLHLPIGGEQRATPAQLARARELLEAWCRATGTPRAEVWGHRELQATECPGTLQRDLVEPFRDATRDEVHWFAETGHAVGGAFWRYWSERGGLAIFGYPLTGELREDDRTVQYFERAVFEWHPENDDPWQVLLRRLGAEALARRTDADDDEKETA